MKKPGLTIIASMLMTLSSESIAQEAFIKQVASAGPSLSFSSPTTGIGSVQQIIVAGAVMTATGGNIEMPTLQIGLPKISSPDWGPLLELLPQPTAGEAVSQLYQTGEENTAVSVQVGFANASLVDQNGNNHTAVMIQRGRGNTAGIFQSGSGLSARLFQQGVGNRALVLQTR